MVENTIVQVPRDMVVNQLDRFLQTLQTLTSFHLVKKLLKASSKLLQYLESIYKNYTSSYRDELLKLCRSLFEKEFSFHTG